MDKKSITTDFSARITGLRQTLHHSRRQMAEFFNTSAVTYRRYEQGLLVPGFFSLYAAASRLGLAVDWLVCARQPVYYREKANQEMALAAFRDTPPEIGELLEHMNKIPLLRHEIMAYFYKFKAEHEDMVAKTTESAATKK